MGEHKWVIERPRLEWEKLTKSTSFAYNYSWAYEQSPARKSTIGTIIM